MNEIVDQISGQWFIPNPDQGQLLPKASSRLITGGVYEFYPDRCVRVALEYRDRAGVTGSTKIEGKIKGAACDSVLVEYSQITPEAATAFGIKRGTLPLLERIEILDSKNLRRHAGAFGTFEDSLNLHLISKYEVEVETRATPSILINSPPASGGSYVTTRLKQGLDLAESKIALGLFPHDLIVREKLDLFLADKTVGKICQQSLPALDLNLRFLGHRLKKLIVHIQDPRQATVAWLHHLDHLNTHRDSIPGWAFALEAVTPDLPVDYFDRSYQEKLTYQVDSHLPLLVEWISGWVMAADNRHHGLEIRFTTFEDFEKNSHSVISNILMHYDICDDKFDWVAKLEKPAEKAEPCWRSTDEWVTDFTAKIDKRASELIPCEMIARFKWRHSSMDPQAPDGTISL